MSDLDKLMAKMNDNKPDKDKSVKKAPETVEIPTVKQIPKIENPKEVEDVDDDTNVKDVEKEKTEQVPSKQEDHALIEQEVAVLQNDGIFRRELILTLKELVDVYKVNTQTLIEIKKKLLNEDDDDGKKD